MEPLSHYLVRNAARFAAQPALIDGQVVVTHAELLQRVALLATRLRADAAGRVLIVLPNGCDVVVCHYAALIAGVDTMLVDIRTPAEEMAGIFATFRPATLVALQTDAEMLHQWYAAPEIRHVLLLGDDTGIPVSPASPTVGSLRWSEGGEVLVDTSAMDTPVLVLSTTGTAGARKYVSLTQRNILAAARNINAFMQIDASAVEVTPLPLHRSFGLGRARCVTLVGGTLIVSPARGDRALALLKRYQANGFSSVPAFFRMLIKTFGERLRPHLEALTYIEIGSAPMEIDDKRFLVDAAPRARICMHYGLTEASRSAFIEFRSAGDKLDSIGKPAPNVEMQVVSAEGQVCRCGEIGEIVVRGEHVCIAYWGNQELTAERLQNGWLRTNDCGSVDEDGYFRLLGRKDDLMNVGGVKVSPEQIEAVARAIPGVADCAAVGITDPSGVYGEVPRLFVLRVPGLDLTEQSVRAYCTDHLSPEAVPRDVVFVDSIPRTDTGKLRRAALRSCHA